MTDIGKVEAGDPGRQQEEEKIRLLTEALPYMRRYSGATVVIKYGGHAMGELELTRQFARDIALLRQVGVNPVLVHGGGPQIGEMLARIGIESRFVDGLRVTTAETVTVAEMVLCGGINKAIVAALQAEGAAAVGLSGKDGGLIHARKLQHTLRAHSNVTEVADLGFVGVPVRVDPAVVNLLAGAGFIPVIAPIGLGEEDGLSYNINADTAAGAIAGAMRARRLLLLTDVAGVLDAAGNLVPELTPAEARRLIETGVIRGGMIPKVETCLQALEDGAEAAVILDGRRPHSTLLEMFTERGEGTLIQAAQSR